MNGEYISGEINFEKTVNDNSMGNCKTPSERGRYEYMIAWRDKKIKNLEERVRAYSEIVNLCLSICTATMDGCGLVSKEKVRQAMRYKYDVNDLGDHYEIKRKEEDNGEES